MLRTITYNNREMYLSRYSILYFVLGLIGIVISIFLSIKILTVQPLEFISWFIALLLILLFLFGGIFLILMYRNHKLIFDNENIIIFDFFGNECKTKWNEIVSLKTNSISGFVSIIDSNKNKIRLHQFLINYTLFINILEQKTRWTIKDLKLPIT
jgi:uncharacterized protein YacL